jgi:hypothetical protein
MAKSSLTYIPEFFVKFFFQPIYTVYAKLFFLDMSIFSNSSHLDWRAGLSDSILKGTHPGTISARFGLIWFGGFKAKDLNVIFDQNMPNLHNRYKSAAGIFCEIFLSADLYRLCKLHQKYTCLQFSIAALF